MKRTKKTNHPGTPLTNLIKISFTRRNIRRKKTFQEKINVSLELKSKGICDETSSEDDSSRTSQAQSESTEIVDEVFLSNVSQEKDSQEEHLTTPEIITTPDNLDEHLAPAEIIELPYKQDEVLPTGKMSKTDNQNKLLSTGLMAETDAEDELLTSTEVIPLLDTQNKVLSTVAMAETGYQDEVPGVMAETDNQDALLTSTEEIKIPDKQDGLLTYAEIMRGADKQDEESSSSEWVTEAEEDCAESPERMRTEKDCAFLESPEIMRTEVENDENWSLDHIIPSEFSGESNMGYEDSILSSPEKMREEINDCGFWNFHDMLSYKVSAVRHAEAAKGIFEGLCSTKLSRDTMGPSTPFLEKFINFSEIRIADTNSSDSEHESDSEKESQDSRNNLVSNKKTENMAATNGKAEASKKQKTHVDRVERKEIESPISLHQQESADSVSTILNEVSNDPESERENANKKKLQQSKKRKASSDDIRGVNSNQQEEETSVKPKQSTVQKENDLMSNKLSKKATATKHKRKNVSKEQKTLQHANRRKNAESPILLHQQESADSISTILNEVSNNLESERQNADKKKSEKSKKRKASSDVTRGVIINQPEEVNSLEKNQSTVQGENDLMSNKYPKKTTVSKQKRKNISKKQKSAQHTVRRKSAEPPISPHQQEIADSTSAIFHEVNSNLESESQNGNKRMSQEPRKRNALFDDSSCNQEQIEETSVDQNQDIVQEENDFVTSKYSKKTAAAKQKRKHVSTKQKTLQHTSTRKSAEPPISDHEREFGGINCININELSDYLDSERQNTSEEMSQESEKGLTLKDKFTKMQRKKKSSKQQKSSTLLSKMKANEDEMEEYRGFLETVALCDMSLKRLLTR